MALQLAEFALIRTKAHLSWKTLNTSYGSDHYPIVITTQAGHHTHRICIAICICDLPGPNNSNSFEYYSKFVDAITSSADGHFPLKKPFKFRVSTPWWDSECTAAIKDRKEAEKNYNSAMTQEMFLSYQQIAAKTKKSILAKKRTGSCSVDNITSNDPSSWLEAFSDKLSPTSVPNLDLLPSPSCSLTIQDGLNANFSFEELNVALNDLNDLLSW
ncbi:putative pol-like protein [Operophtera brumata]|uniref:Putative pol-like protein n=1 Tax=Operophtera brumata TaxID=104452 RepID=A0A0L7KT73_OPEBR|nr:putative pol-like protein [Operophtera brumata]